MIFFVRKFGSILTRVLPFLAIFLILPSVVFSAVETGLEKKHHHSKKSKNDFLTSGSRAPAFTLISQNGTRVTLGDFSGKPVFITFIYTSCKTSCSLILQNLDLVEKRISPGSKPAFLAVTVDPDTDTVPVLKRYMEDTGLSETGLSLLTGEVREIKRVLRAYKVKVAHIAETGEVVGHPNMGYLIDANGLIKDVIVFGT